MSLREDRPSSNHDERPAGSPVDILLLHYTGMREAEAALARLCDPAAKVSSHWFVHEDGRVVQLVDESRRAWHAGVSCWAGERDINARSIGIEIHNPGHEWGYRPFPEPQMAAVVELCGEILARHPIPPERVLGHSDVAPERKTDPGELFPWKTLHAAGIGRWVAPTPAGPPAGLAPGDSGEAVFTLQRALAAYGYGIEASGDYGNATRLVVAAFQRHFRPERIDGIADGSTLDTLQRLLTAA